MNLLSLACFEAVARTLSFTAAAEELFLSQPALSKHISRLEREWECELFSRSTRQVLLTETGARLLPYARRVLSAARSLNREAERVKIESDRSFVIGFITQGHAALAARMVDELAAMGRTTSPTLIRELPKRMLDMAKSGEIDIGLHCLACVQNQPGLEYAVVPGVGFRAMVSNRHPFAARDSVSLREFSGESLVVFPREHDEEVFDFIMQKFQEAGVVPTILAEVQGQAHADAYVTSNRAIGMASMCAQPSLGMTAVRVDELSDALAVVLIWRQGGEKSITRRLVQRILENDSFFCGINESV